MLTPLAGICVRIRTNKVYARQLGRVYKRELKEYFEVLKQHQLVKASADEIEEFSACAPRPWAASEGRTTLTPRHHYPSRAVFLPSSTSAASSLLSNSSVALKQGKSGSSAQLAIPKSLTEVRRRPHHVRAIRISLR